MRIAAILLSAALAACAEGTGLGLNLVPQGEVEQSGLEAWQEIRAKSPASADAGAQQRARRIADRVLQGAGEDPAKWEVVVFSGAEINAFALPGNKIGIYEGMTRVAESDDQLAAVIGHEIGHNKARHAAERMSTEMVTRMGTSLLGTVFGGGPQGQLLAVLAGAGAQYGIVLPYDRNQEAQADQLGLHYMARAGYDPNGAVALWQKMEQVAGGGPPAFLSTHPATAERIQALQAEMPQAETEYRAARG
jgi:predicted Zn-dependent protease